MLKISLEGLKSLEYTFLNDGNETGMIIISWEQFEKVRSALYNRKPDPNAHPSDYVDDFIVGPWGHMHPNYYKVHGGIVEDRYLYLALHHETDEGLEQLAETFGLPTRAKKDFIRHSAHHEQVGG